MGWWHRYFIKTILKLQSEQDAIVPVVLAEIRLNK